MIGYYSLNTILSEEERKLYNINYSTRDGLTPLMIAIYNLNYEMVKLLDHGANISKKAITNPNVLNFLGSAKYKIEIQKENILKILKLLSQKNR